MDKSLLEMAVDIVKAQASTKGMSQEEVEAALIRYHGALSCIQQGGGNGCGKVSGEHGTADSIRHAGLQATMEPRSSIQEDRVICLECGGDFRQLTANHLRSHHLTPREYKKKWGFPMKQPLAAKLLTRLRSRSAKKRGLPKKLQEYLEDRQHRKLAVNAGPH